jgi:hypothetical protein
LDESGDLLSPQEMAQFEGELAWPERFDREHDKATEYEVGSIAYPGQYQQSPVPRKGGIIKQMPASSSLRKSRSSLLEPERVAATSPMMIHTEEQRRREERERQKVARDYAKLREEQAGRSAEPTSAGSMR